MFRSTLLRVRKISIPGGISQQIFVPSISNGLLEHNDSSLGKVAVSNCCAQGLERTRADT